MTESDNALDKKIETLRTLLGQSEDEGHTINSSAPKPLPIATKTFIPRDFLHFKKHNSEQSLVLIKRFLSKHGKPNENSTELQVLTNAIGRIIDKSSNKRPKQ